MNFSEKDKIPGENQPGPSQSEIDTSPVEFSLSPGLAARLGRLNLSIAFSSYQSNLLYTLGVLPNGGAHLHQSAMAKPMGLALNGRQRLVLSAGFQIIEFANVLAPHERVNQAFDACYMPRTMHITGELDAHDVAVDRGGRIVFANTRYNCLATLSSRHSFEMLWKPPFISALVAEDRCHLNGLAMAGGRPAYVTAVSRSDTIDGWRDRRSDGGVVVDVHSGEIICEGLSMPHSPRLHRNELWILNAGTGELGVVSGLEDGGSGKGRFTPRIFCPGFLRGLAFHDNLAFVGLSKPRHQRFEGLALDRKLQDADSEPWCGIQVIDLDKGCCVDWLRIDGAVAELFDVCVIPGSKCVMTVSPNSADVVGLVTHPQEGSDAAGGVVRTSAEYGESL